MYNSQAYNGKPLKTPIKQLSKKFRAKKAKDTRTMLASSSQGLYSGLAYHNLNGFTNEVYFLIWEMKLCHSSANEPAPNLAKVGMTLKGSGLNQGKIP